MRRERPAATCARKTTATFTRGAKDIAEHVYVIKVLGMHKQIERVSHSHRKRTKATMVERINLITTKTEHRILATMDSCFGFLRPCQHGTAKTLAQGSHRKNNK